MLYEFEINLINSIILLFLMYKFYILYYNKSSLKYLYNQNKLYDVSLIFGLLGAGIGLIALCCVFYVLFSAFFQTEKIKQDKTTKKNVPINQQQDVSQNSQANKVNQNNDSPYDSSNKEINNNVIQKNNEKSIKI